MSNLTNPEPAGYSTVSPYFVVDDIDKELSFLAAALGAEILDGLKAPDGSTMHGEARIGNVVIMIGGARAEFPATKSTVYIYTEDVDKTYQNALKHGAISIVEPRDEFYGDRAGGIASPQGNQFWIAQQIEEVSTEEAERRFAEMGQ
ncbi:MAG: VOC family protein [Flammeovirgaceae bacterium]